MAFCSIHTMLTPMNKLLLAHPALHYLGFNRYQAYRAGLTFKHHENDIIRELYNHWRGDKNQFIEESKRFSEHLIETLRAERDFSIHEADSAWDTTPFDIGEEEQD